MLPYISSAERDVFGDSLSLANVMRWIVFRCAAAYKKSGMRRASITAHEAEKETGTPAQDFNAIINSLSFCGAFAFCERQSDGRTDVEIDASFFSAVYGGEKELSAGRAAKTKKGFSAMRSFAEAWSVYPRKEGRAAAAQSYAGSIAKGARPEDIKKGTENFALICKIKNRPPKYIPYGSTFFAQERWIDYVESAEADSYRKANFTTF